MVQTHNFSVLAIFASLNYSNTNKTEKFLPLQLAGMPTLTARTYFSCISKIWKNAWTLLNLWKNSLSSYIYSIASDILIFWREDKACKSIYYTELYFLLLNWYDNLFTAALCWLLYLIVHDGLFYLPLLALSSFPEDPFLTYSTESSPPSQFSTFSLWPS